MLPIRRLLDSELDKYEQHLLALDDNSKHLRFAYRVTDAAIIKFMQTVKDNAHLHKIFVIENSNLDVVGVGHISIADGNMELALSVLPAYQGKGYGHELMGRCLEWCRNRGITNGFMVCLQSNNTIKHLASKHGLKMTSEYGETTADIILPEATAESYAREVFASNLAAFDHFNKSTTKFANDTIQALIFSY